ncbi:hypothetical protein LOTGIDRAFT_154588 [Lottia gigantea]|uniref:Fibrinogen C-terminal domain-containing protein n=1 Tax=Lottia gigantea TaxID=225164 RepID=V3Z8A2_LOTGI|nr:hypothetical protein LOTGIDRAFT_154588 [Lottia gigantea]ESO87098.1 hypothetical protein LOTGIDRAFT_154588 [Lottia gigantea]
MPTRLCRFVETLKILSLLTRFATGDISAYFEKSWTYVDVCNEPVQATLTSHSVDSCAIICSHDSECRRFLFCSSTSSCKLYMDNGGCRIAEGTLGCSCFLKKNGCINGSCKCQLGYYGDNCQHVIKDCTEAEEHGIKYNKPVVLYVKPPGVTEPFNIVCYPLGGGWSYFLHRNSQCQFENFNRSLMEYETGFGTFRHNMWLGFDKIVPLLSIPNAAYSFNINLLKEDGSRCDTYYNGILLNKVKRMYTLYLGQYVATKLPCGNSFTGILYLNGKSFSTADRDLTGGNNCATTLGGVFVQNQWQNITFDYSSSHVSDKNNYHKEILAYFQSGACGLYTKNAPPVGSLTKTLDKQICHCLRAVKYYRCRLSNFTKCAHTSHDKSLPKVL